MSALEKNKEFVPRLVIAGAGSGTGKTSVTLGLIAALRRRGSRVQPFKVGPDFLDPTWHTRAAGRAGYNLDGWMTDRPYVSGLFARQTADADFALVEGVMGMFDGASPVDLAGSTAEIAVWLDAPVLLVVNAWGMAGTIAALVKGFVEFEPRVRVAGVVANFCGSAGHATLLEKALAARDLPPLIGWLPRDGLPALPDRHLGLRAAFTIEENTAMIDSLADACESGLDLDRLWKAAGGDGANAASGESDDVNSPDSESRDSRPGAAPGLDRDRVRIGIARDEAFYFYYPDNLAMLAERGTELVEFSPLHDRALPSNLDALYFGGGYPEEFAVELEANQAMRAEVAAFAARGFVYAECGGLMYLSGSLTTVPGATHEMAGVLPFGTRMLPKRRMLGYVETTLEEATLFGDPGSVLRGHEFHYSEITDDPGASSGLADEWRTVFSLRGRRGGEPRREGYYNGRVLASYVHQHFGSAPGALDALLENARAVRTSGTV